MATNETSPVQKRLNGGAQYKLEGRGEPHATLNARECFCSAADNEHKDQHKGMKSLV